MNFRLGINVLDPDTSPGNECPRLTVTVRSNFDVCCDRLNHVSTISHDRLDRQRMRARSLVPGRADSPAAGCRYEWCSSICVPTRKELQPPSAAGSPGSWPPSQLCGRPRSARLPLDRLALANGPQPPPTMKTLRRASDVMCSPVLEIAIDEDRPLTCETYAPRPPSVRSRLNAALMRPRCVNACGKLPRASP